MSSQVSQSMLSGRGAACAPEARAAKAVIAADAPRKCLRVTCFMSVLASWHDFNVLCVRMRQEDDEAIGLDRQEAETAVLTPWMRTARRQPGRDNIEGRPHRGRPFNRSRSVCELPRGHGAEMAPHWRPIQYGTNLSSIMYAMGALAPPARSHGVCCHTYSPWTRSCGRIA